MITDIIIRPLAGHFDTGQIRDHLLGLPHVVLDPLEQRIFMMTSSTAEVELAVQKRHELPSEFPTLAILVDVVDTEVEINYRIAEVEPARDFVLWLRERYELRFLDEEFNDLTAYCDENLEFLFGPAS